MEIDDREKKVRRLKEIMAGAVPATPGQAPNLANGATLLVVDDQSPRGRLVREAARIAGWYVWGQPEIVRLLDDEFQPSLYMCSTEALERIVCHLQQLEDCAQSGLSSPFEPSGA